MVYDPSLGYDDELPDAYQKWLGNTDVDNILSIIQSSDELLFEKIDNLLWNHYCEKVDGAHVDEEE